MSVTSDIIQHHVYSSFGTLVAIKDQNGNDVTAAPPVAPYFTFTGREYDKESGLYYYRARFYDSLLGRFIESDPSPGVKSVPESFINRYIYAYNLPSIFLDPSGQKNWQLNALFYAAAGTLVAGPVIGISAGLIYAASQDPKFRNALIVAAIIVSGVAVGVSTANPYYGAAWIGGGLGAYNASKDPNKTVPEGALQGAVIGVAAVYIGGVIGSQLGSAVVGKIVAGAIFGFGASAYADGNSSANVKAAKQGAITGGASSVIPSDGGSSNTGTPSSSPTSSGGTSNSSQGCWGCYQ